MNDLRIDVTPPPLTDARRTELRTTTPLSIPSSDGDGDADGVDRSASRAAPSARYELYRRFWTQVVDELRRAAPTWYVPTPPPRSSLGIGCGVSYVHYRIAFADRRLRVDFYIDAPDPELQRERWEYFLARREQIEADVGQPLTWQEQPDSRASQIAIYHPAEAEIAVERRWSGYRTWAVDSYVRLRTATEPLLHALMR